MNNAITGNSIIMGLYEDKYLFIEFLKEIKIDVITGRYAKKTITIRVEWYFV